MGTEKSSGGPRLLGSRWSKLAGLLLLLVILFLVPVIVGRRPYVLHVGVMVLLNIIMVSSLRTIFLSGQISVAHAAFVGCGAYFAGVLAKQFALAPWITIPAGAVMAMVLGVLLGIPFTRVRAIYFAMVSLFGGIFLVDLIRVARTWTGGGTGLSKIPPLAQSFVGQKVPYYYCTLALTIVCLIILWRIEHSRVGMTWKAIAQSHLVASSVGINEAFYRVLALAVGCFFAGLAGAWYAHFNMTLSPDSYGFLASIFLVMYMLVGGHKSFAGPIIGAGLLYSIPEIFRRLGTAAPLVLGVVMLIVVYLMPEGLAGLYDQLKGQLLKSREERVAKSAAGD